MTKCFCSFSNYLEYTQAEHKDMNMKKTKSFLSSLHICSPAFRPPGPGGHSEKNLQAEVEVNTAPASDVFTV